MHAKKKYGIYLHWIILLYQRLKQRSMEKTAAYTPVQPFMLCIISLTLTADILFYYVMPSTFFGYFLFHVHFGPLSNTRNAPCYCFFLFVYFLFSLLSFLQCYGNCYSCCYCYYYCLTLYAKQCCCGSWLISLLLPQPLELLLLSLYTICAHEKCKQKRIICCFSMSILGSFNNFFSWFCFCSFIRMFFFSPMFTQLNFKQTGLYLCASVSVFTTTNLYTAFLYT